MPSWPSGNVIAAGETFELPDSTRRHVAARSPSTGAASVGLGDWPEFTRRTAAAALGTAIPGVNDLRDAREGAMWLAEDQSAIARARHFVRSWSDQNDLDAERANEVELIVCELVTNAIRHGAPPYRLELERKGQYLHGEVSDGSPIGPRLHDHPDHNGGFGLRIVDTLTTAWGVSTADSNKTIWFEVDTDRDHT